MGALREYIKDNPAPMGGGLVDLQALQSPVACDTETTGVNSWKGDRPYAFSFCDSKGKQAFIRGRVNPLTREVEIPLPDLRTLRIFFGNTATVKVFHNAKFDIRMLESIGVSVGGRIQETMYGVHALNTLEPSFKLKRLGEKYLELPKDDETDLRKATSKARLEAKKKGWAISEKKGHGDDPIAADYWLAPPLLLQKYALRDAERTMLLWAMADGIMAEEEVRDTYEKEIRLFWITYNMETRGVKINPGLVQSEIKKHEAQLAECLGQVDKWKKGLNLNSPKQLQRFMYFKKEAGGLGIPMVCDPHTGNPTTDAEALQGMTHPFARLISRVRAHDKALSSFFHKYRDLMIPDPLNPGGFVLHPDFQQVGPVTGRYSCRQPNLQNVADASGAGFTLEPIQARMPFGPRPGHVWYHFDFSQLEVRIFADVAQEKFMLAAIKSGRDLHTECANKVWGGDSPAAIRAAMSALGLDGKEKDDSALVKGAVEAVRAKSKLGPRLTPEQLAHDWLKGFGGDIVKAESSLEKKNSRKKAKILLFLKVYGGGAQAAASKMLCSKEEAYTFLNDYDTAFPRIQEYTDEMSRQSMRDGFIRNRYGRRLMVDPDYSYRSVNYMVQGSAADLLKDKMIAVEDYIARMRKERGFKVWQVLTIHDEIVLEIAKEHCFPWFLRKIKRIMEDHGGRFGVETEVEVARTVKDWSHKEPVSL